MTEESGVWLSTSRPPKTTSKKQKAVLKCKPYHKTTTFFSSTLTQNSPPPPQLFTSRKQSCLTDYFRKGCENATPCVTTNIIDTASDVVLDSVQFNQHLVQGYAEYETGGEPSESLENGCERRKSSESCKFEKCHEHVAKQEPHFADNTFVTSGDYNKSTIQNENFDRSENPAKVLKLQHDVNTSRLNQNMPVLEDVTNSPSVKTTLTEDTGSDCGHVISSLMFTQTENGLGLDLNDHSLLSGSDFNNELFQARKQKHYMDMGTLQFTEDQTQSCAI